MKVTVDVVNGIEKNIEIDQNTTYEDLIRKVGETPEGAVALVDGQPHPEDEKVTDKKPKEKKVKILKTVSGGQNP